MQDDSSLRKEVNIAILALRESGAYDALYEKWFS
jgi:ABC-type amino acid transport substrate-binding protein